MTNRMVKIRIQEHCSSIRCKRSNTKLTSHFIEKQHTAQDICWTVIEQLIEGETQIEKKLLEYEQRWIYRLSTYPEGLNEEVPWTNMQL